MTLDAGAPATAETLTLADRLGAAKLDALASSPALRAEIAKAGVPEAALAASVTGLGKAIGDALRIPVGEIFMAASLRCATLEPRYAAPEHDGEPGILTLAAMVIESSHHPTITVTCDGVSVSLRFDVELSLDVSGAQLLIERGRAVGARTGTTSGTTRVSCLTDTPFELGSPEFELPGELRFSRPVAMSAIEA